MENIKRNFIQHNVLIIFFNFYSVTFLTFLNFHLVALMLRSCIRLSSLKTIMYVYCGSTVVRVTESICLKKQTIRYDTIAEFNVDSES